MGSCGRTQSPRRDEGMTTLKRNYAPVYTDDADVRCLPYRTTPQLFGAGSPESYVSMPCSQKADNQWFSCRTAAFSTKMSGLLQAVVCTLLSMLHTSLAASVILETTVVNIDGSISGTSYEANNTLGPVLSSKLCHEHTCVLCTPMSGVCLIDCHELCLLRYALCPLSTAVPIFKCCSHTKSSVHDRVLLTVA